MYVLNVPIGKLLVKISLFNKKKAYATIYIVVTYKLGGSDILYEILH